MKKEEARQSLVNTKVYVAGKSAEIQKKLFELGFKWFISDETTVQHPNEPFLTIKEIGIQCADDMEYFTEHTNKEVTADYILNLTWKDKPEFNPFDKVLVRDYNCEVWRPRYYYDACDRMGVEIRRHIISYEGNEHLAWKTDKPE